MRPFVSVLIPCRNEARFLGPCLDSILAGDYPAERMEVIVADGMSQDGTREQAEEYARRDARIRRIDNPRRTTPVGLNRAIAESRGEIVLRIDAHATVCRDYISRSVEYLESSGADNVGGTMRIEARDRGPFAEPIRLTLGHSFGVGNAHYRTGTREIRWVDTVYGGCWRKEVFHRVGGFNERLDRGQDLEFNLRLRRRGGRILMVPEIVASNWSRTTLASFLRHNWINGVWVVLAFAYSEAMPVRPRQLVPAVFVAALCASLALVPWTGLPLGALAGAYLTVSLAVSMRVAAGEKKAFLAALLPVTFAALHLGYGAGSLWGVVRSAAAWARKKSTPEICSSEMAG